MIEIALLVVGMGWLAYRMEKVVVDVAKVMERPFPSAPPPTTCSFTPSKCSFVASVPCAPCSPTKCEASSVTVAPAVIADADLDERFAKILERALRRPAIVKHMTPTVRESNGRSQVQKRLRARGFSL